MATENLPVSLQQLRDEAKERLYIGRIADMRSQTNAQLSALDVDVPAILAFADKESSKHGTDVHYMAGAINELAQELKGDTDLATRVFALRRLERSAEQMCTMLYVVDMAKASLKQLEDKQPKLDNFPPPELRKQQDEDARKLETMRQCIRNAKEGMEESMDEFVATLQRLSGEDVEACEAAAYDYVSAMRGHPLPTKVSTRGMRENGELSEAAILDCQKLLLIGQVTKAQERMEKVMVAHGQSYGSLANLLFTIDPENSFTPEHLRLATSAVTGAFGGDEAAAQTFVNIHRLAIHSGEIYSAMRYKKIQADGNAPMDEHTLDETNGFIQAHLEGIKQVLPELSESVPLVCNIAADSYLHTVGRNFGLNDKQLQLG